MTQSMNTLSGTNLWHISHIRNRNIFLPYSPFHWGWYHFFDTLLSWHFWQTCWLSDTQRDAHRQNLEGISMKFFPARSQGCKERPMIGPLPVVAPLGVGLDGSAVHLHPIGPTHPVPQLCLRPHLEREREKLAWPYSGQQRKLPLFLDMVVVFVIALCLCRFWPLVDILERWAKRWSSCPPEEDDFIKDRFCQLQPHSAVYSIVHPKWSTTFCLSQPTGPGSPTGCFLTTREQDLKITCRVQAEQARGKSSPGQGFGAGEGGGLVCFLAIRI